MQSKKDKNKTYEAIVILGGLIRKKSNGTWKTGKFNYIRVLAGYYLYKDMVRSYPIKLIVSGGKGIYKDIPGAPAVATVMKQELVRLGLSSKKIAEEKNTASTYQELLWLRKLLDKKLGKINIISNGYHLPRIKTMINFLPELKKVKNKIILYSAEKVSVKYNKGLKKEIGNNKKDPKMNKIISQEKKGIKALKSGNYKFR